MTILVDTNVLVKYHYPAEPFHADAVQAVIRLLTAGHNLCIVPQNYYEFWVTATRPLHARGIGATPTQAAAVIAAFPTTFTRLPEPPGLLDDWLRLVEAHDCKGKVAHDARLVAAMAGHGVAHLLTFNGRDFARFSGVAVLDPLHLPA